MLTPQLQHAVEQVYDEFRSPKPHKIEGCPCCLKHMAVCKLLESNLRDLTSRELGNYAVSVFSTAGNVPDFKYFLPRMLENALVEPWPWPSLELLFGKLPLANWSAWPASQRAAICRLIDIRYRELLACADGEELDRLLCTVAQADLSLQPYLEELAKHPAALQLVFEFNSFAYFKRRRLENTYWKERPDAAKSVLAFFELTYIAKQLGLPDRPA